MLYNYGEEVMEDYKIKATFMTLGHQIGKMNTKINELKEELAETQLILKAYIEAIGPEQLKDIYARTTYIYEEMMEKKRL